LRFRDPKEPFSIILLDVDKLKSLNSELGNPGADKVLTGIFETLRDVVRPHEAYRLRGDEAGTILPGVSLDDAQRLGRDHEDRRRAPVVGRAFDQDDADRERWDRHLHERGADR
jgi:diguanylate cyclase (GGDEF)-like protein